MQHQLSKDNHMKDYPKLPIYQFLKKIPSLEFLFVYLVVFQQKKLNGKIRFFYGEFD
jgi:hypothetical protein